LKGIDLSRYYRPELDGLRFFAFLCVFCFHRMDYVAVDAARDPWLFKLSMAGAFGVPVFFLLSAFLITELLMREREATGTVHVKAFYVRRILRIWPLYFAAFFGLAVLNHFLPGVGPASHSSWLAFSFFAGNWYIVRHGWIAGPVDPLWSISVEEQFYIFIPLVVAFAGRRGVRVASYILLGIAYLVIVRYALHPVAGDNGEWTDSFVHFQFFCAGTLLALVLRGRLPQLHLLARLSAFALGFGCWFLCLRLGVQSWEPHAGVGGSIAGWALMLLGAILFFLSALGTPERFIPRWLAYLGRISYGLYIFHSLILYLVFEKGGAGLTKVVRVLHLPEGVRASVGTVVVLAATFVVAHLSFKFFERPFLRLKERFTFVRAREEEGSQTANV
jgi:peptidoglycan/LPS O-acetylase OafA/YrhL